MRIKTFCDGWIVIERHVNEFCKRHDVVSIQTQVLKDNQVIAIVIYKEA